jgi:hypothetical protein
MQGSVKRHRAARQQCECQRDEHLACLFNRHDPGKRRHHQIHRKVRKQVPVDVVVLAKPGGMPAIG